MKLEAYAAVLRRGLLKTNCSYCFAKLPLTYNSACSRTRTFCHECGIANYCDRDCHVKDCPSHRVECEIVRRGTAVPSDFQRLLIRVCGRYDYEKSRGTTYRQRVLETDVYIGDGICIPPEILLRHEEENVYIDMISNSTDLDEDDEISVLLEQTIATSVHIYFMGEYIGLGVYPGLACLPNTCSRYESYVNVFEGTDFVFRATKPFVLRSLDDIPVSMAHRGMSKYRREKILKDLGIDCECARCESEANVYDEPNPQVENVLSHSDNSDESEPTIKYACCLLLLRRFRKHSGPQQFDRSRLLLELQSLCNKLQKPENSIMYASRISGFDEQVDYERSLLNLLHSAESLNRSGKPDVALLDIVTRKYKELIEDVYKGNTRTLHLSGDSEWRFS